MRTTGLHGGDFRKSISVTCNAKNMPSFRVSIGGIYVQLIETIPSVVRLAPLKKGKDAGCEITLKASRDDLKITDVVFKEAGKELEWQSTIPLKFSLTRIDTATPDKDGKPGEPDTAAAAKKPSSYTYTLAMSCASGEKGTKSGEVTIKTNFPEKPEIKLSGIIEIAK